MAAEVGQPASPIGRTLTLGAATEVEVAVTAFAPLLELLEAVPDPRRAEGKVYRLPHVLLFSILAIVSGGNSYRSVATFIDEHRRRLNRTFGLTWRRAPAHTSIRNILQGLDSGALETVFRKRGDRTLSGLLDAQSFFAGAQCHGMSSSMRLCGQPLTSRV